MNWPIPRTYIKSIIHTQAAHALDMFWIWANHSHLTLSLFCLRGIHTKYIDYVVTNCKLVYQDKYRGSCDNVQKEHFHLKHFTSIVNNWVVSIRSNSVSYIVQKHNVPDDNISKQNRSPLLIMVRMVRGYMQLF